MLGTTVSHYRIVEKIGSGGMGVVYKAWDQKLDRYVALKFLPPSLTTYPEDKKRFIHEAKTTSALDHHNICSIHEIDESRDGRLFICMAYYEGNTLQNIIKQKNLPIKNILEYGLQIAHGLQKAHEKNIIHRDIKPANLMLTSEGVIKILDFGLAKLSTQTKVTQQGTTVGTVAYMSPEQTKGESVDQRSDIWSLGVVLYELVSGELPFKGSYDQAVMYGILNEEPEYLSKLREDIPAELEKIIGKALNKDPAKRFQSMEEMAASLEHVLTLITSGATTKTHVHRLGRRQRRIILRIAPVAAFLLAVLTYFIFIRDAAATPVSIVLLPLDNTTRDVNQEWFVDGMTDALITDLARISGLRIISRSSAMRYKGTNKSAANIASELGVTYVIDGSVIKTENHVKVTTRLIDPESDGYLWVQDYEKEFTDILALQGEVAREIARQIKVNLTQEETTILSGQGKVNQEAHEAYLRGNFYWYKLTQKSLDIALQYYERATELDPNNALAYSGIALVWGGRAQMGYVSMEEAKKNWRPAAGKALTLDSTLAQVHYMNAVMYAWGEWEWKKSVDSFKRAISLNPNMAEAHVYYAHVLYFLKQQEKARQSMTFALKLDPFSPLFRALYAMTLNFEKQYDEAVSTLLNILETSPGHPIAESTLRTIYHQKKMYPEAINVWRRCFENAGDQISINALEEGYQKGGYQMALRQVAESKIAQSQAKYISPWPIGTLYTRAGMRKEALDWLEKALDVRDPNMPYLSVDPIFDDLRDDPRFLRLIHALGLNQTNAF